MVYNNIRWKTPTLGLRPGSCSSLRCSRTAFILTLIYIMSYVSEIISGARAPQGETTTGTASPREDALKEYKKLSNRNLVSILRVSPKDKGVSAFKASKISVLLGYKEGTIHQVAGRLFHPCINHKDFVERYEEKLKNNSKTWIRYEDGVFHILFP